MTKSQAEFQPRNEMEATHEPPNISVRAILLWGIGLVGLIAGALFGVSLLVDAFAEGRDASAQPSSRAPAPSALPAEPNIDANQPEILHRLREQEQERLNSYGPVESEPGIVHIPIDRAIDLVAEEGLPFGKGNIEDGKSQPNDSNTGNSSE